MNKEQESKYEADQNGDIFNRVSGNYIPSDEPIMIFRARDKHAAAMIAYYKKLCADTAHKEAVNVRLRQFVGFAYDHPERMKEPDTVMA